MPGQFLAGLPVGLPLQSLPPAAESHSSYLWWRPVAQHTRASGPVCVGSNVILLLDQVWVSGVLYFIATSSDFLGEETFDTLYDDLCCSGFLDLGLGLNPVVSATVSLCLLLVALLASLSSYLERQLRRHPSILELHRCWFWKCRFVDLLYQSSEETATVLLFSACPLGMWDLGTVAYVLKHVAIRMWRWIDVVVLLLDIPIWKYMTYVRFCGCNSVFFV